MPARSSAAATSSDAVYPISAEGNLIRLKPPIMFAADRSGHQASGITSLAGIAEALNARGVRTARGPAWHTSTVRNLLSRAPA